MVRFAAWNKVSAEGFCRLPSSTNKARVLSVDAGGQSVRAALFSTSGKCLSYSRHRCAHQMDHSAVEHDPRAVLAAIRLCLENLSLEGEISAAAIVSHGASVVCYRRSDGLLLSPIISWQDQRGEQYLGDFPLDNERVHSLTGLPLSSHYGATKLRWCLDHLPQVRKAQRENDLSAGPLMSFLLHQLCSERPVTVDSVNASRTQLWNLHDRQWDPVLSEAFGVPASVLPTGRDACTRYGTLDIAAKRIPVVFASRDQQAAIFFDGWPAENTAYINLGTGAFIQCLIREPGGPKNLLINRVLAGSENSNPLYTLEGTVHGAAGAIPWLEHHLGFEIEAENLREALSLVPEEEKRLYFINGVMGMGSPYWRSKPVAKFSDHLTDQEKLLAWMESVIFMLVENFTLMKPFTAADRLSLSGGFSNLSGLAQRLADLIGLPCYVSSDHEATLRGAAYMAAGQPEEWQTEAPNEYLPTINLGLSNRYQQWREAMGCAK